MLYGGHKAMTGLRALMVALGVALAVAACSSSKKAEKSTKVENAATKLYNDATDQMLAGRYKQAAKLFDQVDREHPYSPWATRAQLMAAYSHYKNQDYDNAVIGLNRFIRLHPGYSNVAYAYYLKGLVYYEQIKDVKRDQEPTRKALAAFQDLVKRHPNSKYSRDSNAKIILMTDHLAAKEMYIGRYYQTRGQHLAAINRFRMVADKYQTSRHVPEALHRLAECYTALGVTDEARKVAAVLGYNYPSSQWYVDSYQLVEGKKFKGPRPKDGRSLLTRAWEWIF